MKTLARLIGFTFLSIVSITAVQAASISITPSTTDLSVGGTFSVQVAVADLGAFGAPSLGGYDIDINFDSSRLDLLSVVFGDSVLSDQLDLFGLGSLTSVTAVAAGSYNVFELSFDNPADLNAQQADAFSLFSVSFRTLAAGNSTISLGVNDLSDAAGVSMPIAAVSSAQVVSAVPLPATAWLLLSGCVGVLSAARRRHCGA